MIVWNKVVLIYRFLMGVAIFVSALYWIQKKIGPTLDPHSCKVEHKTTFNLSKLEFLRYLKITSIKMHKEHIITGGLICFTGFFIDVILFHNTEDVLGLLK